MKRVLLAVATLWMGAAVLIMLAPGCSGPGLWARLVDGAGSRRTDPDKPPEVRLKEWGEGSGPAHDARRMGPPKPTMKEKFAMSLARFLDWPIRILFFGGILVCLAGFVPLLAAIAPLLNLKTIGIGAVGIAVVLFVVEQLVVALFWPVLIGGGIALVAMLVPFWIKGWHWAQRTSGVDLEFDGKDPPNPPA